MRRKRAGVSDNLIRISCAVCIFFMLAGFITVISRFAVNRLLVERSGMNSVLARIVFADFKDERPKEDISPQEVYSDNPYIRKINTVKAVIEAYCGKLLCGREGLINGAYEYDKIIRWDNPKDPSDSERIIYLKNGYLTFVQPRLSDDEIDEIVTSLKDLDDYLGGLDIPLLYVNAGSKVSRDDKQLSGYDEPYEYTNENGSSLLLACEESGINAFDLREALKETSSDWYSLYYKTDHHWTTEAALMATAKIADVLNEEYGFEYDSGLFSETGFEKTIYGNVMFGSQGRSVTMVNASLEDYCLIMPRESMQLEFDIPCENTFLSGDYQDTLFDLKALEGVRGYSSKDYLERPDAYNAIRMNNYPSSNIRNLSTAKNKDKKVLLVQDSFGWYVSTYLATQTGKVDTFNPISNESSLKEYIAETNPDIVIVLCNQRTINPISAAGTDSFWYFD